MLNIGGSDHFSARVIHISTLKFVERDFYCSISRKNIEIDIKNFFKNLTNENRSFYIIKFMQIYRLNYSFLTMILYKYSLANVLVHHSL